MNVFLIVIVILDILSCWQVKTKLKGHQKRITGLAFSQAMNVLVSSGADAHVSRIDNHFNILHTQDFVDV